MENLNAAFWPIASAIATALLVTWLTTYVKWVWDERKRAREEEDYSSMIIAEMSDYARHCAANLRSLVALIEDENIQKPLLLLGIKKFKFTNEYLGNNANITFVIASPEKLGVLPTHLVRAVMRIHLLSRNIEWHIDFVITELESSSDLEFKKKSKELLFALGKYFERGAEGAIHVITNLDEFKHSSKHTLTRTIKVNEATSPVKPMKSLNKTNIVSGNSMDVEQVKIQQKKPYDDRPLEIDDLLDLDILDKLNYQ